MVKISEKHTEVFTSNNVQEKQEQRGANADSQPYRTLWLFGSKTKCVLTPLQIATASLDMDLG